MLLGTRRVCGCLARTERARISVPTSGLASLGRLVWGLLEMYESSQAITEILIPAIIALDDRPACARGPFPARAYVNPSRSMVRHALKRRPSVGW